ncbi:alpha/beta-hydrolase [Microthyrium microscopicum]|uniref:Alpha/beta-hydrolase n=1 Tax=Microthyrium microscopicum TaxID=703497 RepID=A0A6A6US20_9PEZI|nr:alpha/beta-hydrolase [Microthyrium microscopicum]
MADIKTEEGVVNVEAGINLYTKTWKTADTPKAILLFVHGFSDHCNAYGDFFPTLAGKGIEVRSFDQRGWGRSVTKPAERGLTGPTMRVLLDINRFVEEQLPTKGDVPMFLMGHSMGGQEVLCWASYAPVQTRIRIRGYLVEAPFIALHAATKPNPITVALGRLAGKILPGRQMEVKLDEKLLSRDPAVQKAFVDDELCHDTATLQGLSNMLDRASALDTGKISIGRTAGEGRKTRIWLSHGNKDGVCDYTGTERVYKRLHAKDDKELKIYDGWFHKLHAEPSPDKETYADDVANWIFARCGSLYDDVDDEP